MNPPGVVTIITSGGTSMVGSDHVVTAGRRLEGWMDVAITLRAEAFPNDWTLSATSSSPVDGRELAVVEGAAARVLIDDDVVITGYVDRVRRVSDRADHRVTLMGRGKTQDTSPPYPGLGTGSHQRGRPQKRCVARVQDGESGVGTASPVPLDSDATR